MNYIVTVKDLDFTKQLHIPDDIENIKKYVEEWLFAEYSIKDKDYTIVKEETNL
jgi:hypothetical protein